jgi:aminoglycoside phosphotransferase (APT) family kinase protein
MIAVMDRDEITAQVAARLVAGQFPQWAELPVVPVGLNGWDNTTFGLGGELSVRLPSGEDYVPQVSKEHRWLPVLAGRLPLPGPEPVALGRPAAGFPWPWSVYRWIEGEPACLGRVADLTAFAADLAGFLAALYAIDAGGGPPPGLHSAFRGGPLMTWDEQARTSIDLLAEDIDARAAIGVWEAALASPWQQRPVWVHGDVAASNLLLSGGALRAVIDFGCAAAGDPACDLPAGHRDGQTPAAGGLPRPAGSDLLADQRPQHQRLAVKLSHPRSAAADGWHRTAGHEANFCRHLVAPPGTNKPFDASSRAVSSWTATAAAGTARSPRPPRKGRRDTRRVVRGRPRARHHRPCAGLGGKGERTWTVDHP